MGQKEQIKLFEQKIVRSVWDEEKEEWLFSVIDVVELLTDSTNPTDYLKVGSKNAHLRKTIHYRE